MPKKTILSRDVEAAARVIREGGLVAFPTETVYGIGADATNPEAVAAIFHAKGRPPDNPLIVHVASVDGLAGVVDTVAPAAARLLEAFAPGPLTVIVPRGGALAPGVSAGLDTVGIRIPAHPTALSLLRTAGVPIAAPSANRSGRPSGTTIEAVLLDLGGRVDLVLEGDRPTVGVESTVVDCTCEPPAVLRHGGIPLEALRRVLPETASRGGNLQASPGTRHPHYAPRARVRLVAGPRPAPDAGYIGLLAPDPGYAAQSVVDSVEAYARSLYDFFRLCDARGLRHVHCADPGSEGLGRAVRDRVLRASEAGEGQ